MSKLLKTRRGHDSEDDYSEADTDISTDIDDDDESIHSISEIDQSDFDYQDELSDLEDSDNKYENSEKEEQDTQDINKEKVKKEESQHSNTEQTQDNTENNAPVLVEEIDYEATKEKRIQEHREYRRKLAEDPSFVPYVGLFWSHDDRYRDDAFSETRAASGSSSSKTGSEIHFNPSLKNGGNTDRSMDPLMYKKWDHSGYEELLRLEEQEERLKREAIENGQEYENTVEHNKFNHRNRGNYNGRGGHHNNGQRYHNFNNHHRNRNYQQNRQQKPTEEWPQLSDTTTNKNATPTIVENIAWATATPELLQSHDNGPSTGILVDVGTTEQVNDTNQSEASKDIAIVNAWGSIDRVEEVETLNEGSGDKGWGVETKIPASDDWGKSDSGTVGWGVETVLPSAENWGNQESTSPPSNEKEKETPQPENTNWDSSKPTDNWNSPSPSNVEDNSSNWTEKNKTAKTIRGWNESSSKEQIPDQFMDAESQIGSPKLTPTTKTSIPTEEKASNSWAEMSANAEPEKTFNNNNNYRRHRDTFSPNERSFTPRNRNNFEENNRGYKKQNDRGYTKQHYNSRSPVIKQSQEEDNWNSTAESKGWAKISPTTQSEPSGDSWGAVDQTASTDAGGWGEVTNEKQETVNTTTTTETTAGWGASPTPAEPSNKPSTSSGWGETSVAPQSSASGWDAPTGSSTPNETSTPAEPDTTGWSTPSASPAQTSHSGWGSSNVTASTTDKNSGWDLSPTPAEPSKSGWGTSSTYTEPKSEFNTSPAVTDSSPSRWGHSNDYTSKPRQNGWSNGQSSNSSNWNADKKARMNKQIQDQPRKGRGYLSQKLENTPPVDTTPVSVNEEFQNHGDSDSDVEIILEADEEPDWVKNEQILGMTAPGEEIPSPVTVEESPRARNNYSRNYENNSPQPESPYRNNGRNYNHQRKPRRNFDENWRQRDDVSSDSENRTTTTAVPMYYPQPHHHMNTGNITYLPMIPNGPNGSPMYAMPFPMGLPSSSPIAGSTSPNNSVGGSDSSPHINNSNIKFYSPMINGPNGLQLPPGYEANGMVYYGMDPSSMYGPPQPFYYYGPPVPGNGPPMFSTQQRLSPNDLQNDDDLVEDGWGPPPDVDDGEEQWNNSKSSPKGNYQNNSSAYYTYHH